MEIDGAPADIDDIRALGLTNYGHYTAMLVAAQRVRGLSLHLDRLVRDCRTLFGGELDPDRVRALARRVAARLSSPTMVRVAVFAPGLDVGRPAIAVPWRILVTTRPAVTGVPAPLRLMTTDYQRALPEVKHVGLFGNVYHRRAAQLAGFDDVLFVDARSRVVEGATWNVGFFDGTHIVWPVGDYLPGVTRQLVAELAERLGLPSRYAPVRRTDLSGMRAVFATNASVGVRPVLSIDGVSFAPDAEILTSLRREYLALPTDLL